METFKVLKIAIEEWVFVIPFDFERHRSCLKRACVIHFVGLRFARHTVNGPNNYKLMLFPSLSLEGITKTLGSFGFPTAGPNDFLDRDR